LTKGTIYRQRRLEHNIQGNARETNGTWQGTKTFLTPTFALFEKIWSGRHDIFGPVGRLT
jgi:hypothetical protein